MLVIFDDICVTEMKIGNIHNRHGERHKYYGHILHNQEPFFNDAASIQNARVRVLLSLKIGQKVAPKIKPENRHKKD